MGQTRLAAWLRQRRVRGYAQVAARAIEAARAQQVRLPGEDVAAALVVELATDILALDERLKTLEAAADDRVPGPSPREVDRVDARLRARPRRDAARRLPAT